MNKSKLPDRAKPPGTNIIISMKSSSMYFVIILYLDISRNFFIPVLFVILLSEPMFFQIEILFGLIKKPYS